jgi:hypothetical protein
MIAVCHKVKQCQKKRVGFEINIGSFNVRDYKIKNILDLFKK